MTFQDIRFALESNGVEKEDREELLLFCKKNGKNFEKLDEILVEKGYEKIFTDEFFGWADMDERDDGSDFVEKMHHKHTWNE